MSDLATKIRKVLAKPSLCVLATVDAKGRPWARYVMGTMNEAMEIRFSTFVHARKVKQMRKNPEVHLTTGVASLRTAKRYLQIQGLAEVSRTKAERHAYWNPGLEAYFKGPDDPNYAVVIIRPYRIEYATMSAMMPEVWMK